MNRALYEYAIPCIILTVILTLVLITFHQSYDKQAGFEDKIYEKIQ